MEKELIIAIDFDGTLCYNVQFPNIGKPRLWLINKAIEWKRKGYKLILWTCREDVLDTDYSPYWKAGNYLTDAVNFCKEYGLEFDAINMNLAETVDPNAKYSRKIFADFYIDDKSVIFDDITENFIFPNTSNTLEN